MVYTFWLSLHLFIYSLVAGATEAPCVRSYQINPEKGTVTYRSYDDNFRLREIPVPQANSSLVALSTGNPPGCPLAGRYAKDGKNVYYEGKILRSVLVTDALLRRPENVVGGSDFNFVESSQRIFFGECPLEKANLATFKVTQDGLAQDAGAVFAGCTRLPPRTVVRRISADYFVAGDQVFYQGHLVQGAEAKSFEALSANYGRDRMHLAFRDQLFNEREAKSFKFVDPTGSDEHFTKDRLGVYFNNRVIAGADPGTFKRVDPAHLEPNDPKICAELPCASDKDKLFMEDDRRPVVAGQVGATEIMAALKRDVVPLTAGYTRFGSYIYFAAKLLPEVDARTFVVIDEFGFAKDKAHVFCRELRTDFDVRSFTFWPRNEAACGKAAHYVKDEHGAYLVTGCDPDLFQRVEGADVVGFQVAGNPGCARDGKNIYRCGTPLRAFGKAASCGIK